jgi:tetratricopeptide (TPR) repeat protein
MGAEFFSKNDYANALTTFDSVLTLNPGSLIAINNKALIYLRQDNAAAFEETVDSYIEKLTPANDTVRLKQARTMAIDYFRSTGSKALQANKTDDALVALNKASKYGEDKDVYYFYADLYNRQKAFDKAAENAQKGLALEKGDAAAKAKFYYQLASAQAGAGKNAEACASFKNAMYGAFAEPSKAQRTTLKCTD